jgi:hypothetical protein
MIRRGRLKEAKESMMMDTAFRSDYPFRPNGETVMHVMAEYGKTQLFDWFINYFDPDLCP